MLNRNVDSDGFKVKTQIHLVPVLATSVKVIFILQMLLYEYKIKNRKEYNLLSNYKLISKHVLLSSQ